MSGWREVSDIRSRRSAVTFLILGLILDHGSAGSQVPGQWAATGRMATPRAWHTATLLADGRVLIAGGVDPSGAATRSTEIYDPATGTFSPTGSLGAARAGHVAVRLADGRVLVAGGGLSSAEIYDPASGSFTPAGSMSTPRSAFTVTLLPSGQVLVTGGALASGAVVLASAELFDPDADGGVGAFSPLSSMSTPRAQHTATLLGSGKVLIAGGSLGSGLALNTAELYDPASGSFTTLASTMILPRAQHQATLLASGRVLLTGGSAGPAELYDPATAAFSATGTALVPSRSGAASMLLPTGKALLAGGAPSGASAELYDPATGLFTSTGSLVLPRASASAGPLAAVLLADGRLLVAGGADPPTGQPTASAELYTADPVRAYVPSAGGSSVSVIDTASNTVVAAAPVGSGAVGSAVHPAGTRVYVTNTASRTLSVIDAATNAVVATIPLGEGDVEPLGVAVTPDGSRVYVANVQNGTVSVVDTATNAVAATLPVGTFLLGAAVHPDGTRVYLSNDRGPDVVVIETATQRRAASVTVGGASYGVAVAPDGQRLYVALDSGQLAVIDTGANAVVTTVPVAANPRGVAVTPDGARVYVANGGSDTVSIIDAATHTVIASVPVGDAPDGVAVTPDGRRVYVVNSGSDDVSVIDVATGTVTATVAVAAHPSALGLFVGAVVPPAPDRSSADLSITSAASAGSVSSGDSLTYTIRVSNAGPDTAKGVTLRDTLATGAGFVSVSASQGSCAAPPVGGSGAVSCNLGSLASSASATITLAVSVTAGAGQLSNTAGVGSATPDPNAVNNTATATVSVTAGGTIGGGAAGPTAGGASGPTLRAASLLSGPVPKAGNPAAPNGSITGMVTRSDTNAALQGAIVDVSDAGGTGAFVVGGFATDVNGIYLTSVLAPGIYKVKARGLANFGTTFSFNRRNFTDADIVTVTASAAANADIVMPPGGGVIGTVTDTSNVAQSGVTIDVFDANNNFIESASSAAVTGAYSLGLRLAPGVYKVRARKAGFAITFNSDKHTFPTADLVTVQAGSDITVNFKLAAGADIQGTITDGVNPVSGAIIDVYEPGALNFIEGGFVTAANGTYTTQSRLPAGTYVVRARRGNSAASVGLTFYNGKRGFATADPVTVSSAQTVTGKNIQMDTGAAITGTITDGVNPLPGALVDIIDATTPSVLTNTFFQLSVRTNASGIFNTGPQLSTAGSYKIRVRFPGRIDTFYHTGSDIGLDLFTATPISAPGTANVALPAGGTITGTIRERGTNTPLPGVPVNTFRFAANAMSGAFTVLTGSNGNYTIGGLHDGEWVVRADAPGHINAYYSGNADNPATDPPPGRDARTGR